MSAGVPGANSLAVITSGTVPFFINLPANITGVSNINLTGTLTANTVNVNLQINGNTATFTGNLTTSTNLNASNVFTQRLTVDANANVNGTLGVTANVTTPQVIANIAQGTAPFLVNSNTVVANLNAFLL